MVRCGYPNRYPSGRSNVSRARKTRASSGRMLGTSVIRVPQDIDSSIGSLVAWDGQVWVDNGYQLVRIDPRTGHLAGEAAQLPGALAAGLLTSDDRGLGFLGYNGRTGRPRSSTTRRRPNSSAASAMASRLDNRPISLIAMQLRCSLSTRKGGHHALGHPLSPEDRPDRLSLAPAPIHRPGRGDPFPAAR